MRKNNYEFFEGAKKARTPNWFLAIILAIIIMFASQMIGSFLTSWMDPYLKSNPALKMLILLIFTGGIITILLVILEVKVVEKRSLTTIGFGRRNFIGKYLIGFIFGLILFATVVLILNLTGHITVNTNPQFPAGMAALASVLIVLPGWMIQSAAEEVLTRGWLMNVLGARYSAAIAVGVSATLFGVLHALNPNFSVLALINIILVGVFLGMYIIRTNNLWGACGIHAAWNWSQGNVFGFEVSGGKIEMGTLLNLQLKGESWFTGGAFGPEAGLVSTIVILIPTIILGVSLYRKNNRINHI